MSNSKPLVSVICLCYNQGRFVYEAIQSVLNQSYKHIEIIIVDDGSVDESKQLIRDLVAEHPGITFIDLQENVGNCSAFNKGLRASNGDFIIDLAADDVLLPDRVQIGVDTFQNSDSKYGVQFSDAEWIDESGKHLYIHSQKFPHNKIPQGDIYKNLIERYFICPPTMMFKREVITSLGGYDESLSYEDFDFWIRSSRNFWYTYSPNVLVKKRVVKDSLSDKQFKKKSKHLQSTYEICQKILLLNRTNDEKKALSNRIIYEIGVALKLSDFSLAKKYSLLWLKNIRTSYPK